MQSKINSSNNNVQSASLSNSGEVKLGVLNVEMAQGIGLWGSHHRLEI